MGGWYFVIKVIRGVPYHYKQTSWREGGKVRTRCRCLGRADAPQVTGSVVATGSGGALHNTVVAIEATPLASPDERRSLKDALHKIQGRIELDRFAVELIDDLLRDIDTISLPSLVTALSKIADEMMERYAQEGIIELLAQAKASIAKRLPATPPVTAATLSRPATGRNTTHLVATDRELIGLLMSGFGGKDMWRLPVGQWQRPWQARRAASKAPAKVDARVISLPLKLGIPVSTTPAARVVGVPAWRQVRDVPCYRMSKDSIQLPDASRFVGKTSGERGAAFGEALLHELCHGAAAPKRLDIERQKTGVNDIVGYARDEVVTELAACLIGRRLGLPRYDLYANARSYIDGWLGKAEAGTLERAELIEDALRVADYVMAHIAESDQKSTSEIRGPQSGLVE